MRAPGVRRHWKTAVASVIMAASVALGFRDSLVQAIVVGMVVYSVGLFAVGAVRRDAEGRLELRV
jgi:hypothetical protein